MNIKKIKGLTRYNETKISCVYFLCKDEEIMYVGQTTDLRARIKTHRHIHGNNFNAVYYLRVYGKDELCQIESFYIHKLLPPWNATITPNSGRKSSPIGREEIRSDYIKNGNDSIEMETPFDNLPDSAFLRLERIVGNRKKNIPPVIPISKSEWFKLIQEGKAPKQVHLGRSSLWRVSDIRQFISGMTKSQELLAENGSAPVAPGDRNSKQEKMSWKM